MKLQNARRRQVNARHNPSLVESLETRRLMAVIAGPIVNPANGNSYYLLSQNTWTASESEAQSLGGHLVTVNNQAENDWVFNSFAVAGGSGRALWTGYSRPTSGAAFGWASGETSTYTNWAPQEPNFPDERFAYMLPTLNSNPLAGKWNNDYDRISSSFLAGGVTIPFSIHGVVEVSTPEAEVRGNNVVISDNDTTVSASDFTDFGTTTVGGSLIRTFTVRNTGNAPLTTTGLKITNINGTPSTAFTVTESLT